VFVHMIVCVCASVCVHVFAGVLSIPWSVCGMRVCSRDK
jgi:hypothetical protein